MLWSASDVSLGICKLMHLPMSLDSTQCRFFKRKSDVKETRLCSFGSYQQKLAAAVQAAYLVARRIEKIKKPRTMLGELVLHSRNRK